ncbi:MAG: hypothetical protein ACI8ZN_001498 [Bacteroidia bacterium]|jgi:hypothetical protein
MKQGIRWCMVVFVCVSVYTFSSAQLNNSFFNSSKKNQAVGDFSLSLENLNYFRNVEYKTLQDEGRTLFGYQFSPELNYQLSDHVQVSAGWWIQRDFGGSGFYQSIPIYSLQIKKNEHTLRFGNLLGGMQHNLLEPLYDPERMIENRLENGFQYVRNTNKLAFDFWIDWQKMIYPYSPFREEFTLGIVAQPYLLNSARQTLSLPVQILAFHKGGEIDTSHQRTISMFNFNYGVRYQFKPHNSNIDSVEVQANLLYYEDISTIPENFIDGLGQMFSASIYFKKYYGLMLNYWDAHQFQGPSGDVIFQSVSAQNPMLYTTHYRKLAMLRVFYQRDVAKDLRFALRANYMYDINKSTQDVVAEFYFRWTPQFKIANVQTL